ncbi:MAG: roadblock/LC7 domain-containing protein [Gemmatimonadota bacterium]
MLDEISSLGFGITINADTPPVIRQAEALRIEGRLAEAEQTALVALASDPYLPDAHDALARIFAEREDVQRAHDEWESTLRLDPHHPGALKGLAFLAVRRRDLSSSLRFIDAVLASSPSDRQALDARAKLGELVSNSPSHLDREDVATAPRGVIAVTPVTPTEQGGPPRLIAALLVDGDGHVLSDLAPVRNPGMSGEALAAVMSQLAIDAARTLADLGLGELTAMLAECAEGALALVPGRDGHTVVVAADRNVPPGLLRRELLRQRARADSVMEST